MRKLDIELSNLQKREYRYQSLLKEKREKRDLIIFLPLFFMRRYLILLSPTILTVILSCWLYSGIGEDIALIILCGILFQVFFFVMAYVDTPLWNISVEENTLDYLKKRKIHRQEINWKEKEKETKKQEFLSLKKEALDRKTRIDFIQFLKDNPKVLKDLKDGDLL